jgi:hypothetical protein
MAECLVWLFVLLGLKRGETRNKHRRGEKMKREGRRDQTRGKERRGKGKEVFTAPMW